MREHLTLETVPTLLTAAFILLATSTAAAQTNAPFKSNAQSRYYDFWPGVWQQVIDGEPDPAATTFVVRRSIHPAVYIEEWTQVDEGIARKSIAIRAWDQVNKQWKFTWVGENALYQTWHSERVGDDWYIVKEWNIDGQAFLTRQAWIPDGPDTLMRVFERSFDHRASWELVSQTMFERISHAAH